MLQRNSVRSRSSAGKLTEEDAKVEEPGEGSWAEVKAEVTAEDPAKAETKARAEATKELVGVQVTGARVELHQGAQIIVHDDSEVAVKGVGDWIITVPDGCTTAELRKNTERMPKGSELKFTGTPTAGGLCVIVMRGTEDQVKQEIESRTWKSPPICETDKIWGIVPDVEDAKNGKSRDLTQIDSNNTNSGLPSGIIRPVDRIISSIGQLNPPSWGLDRIDDRSGLDNSYYTPFLARRGRGVHVYVTDTGIRTTHDDFGGRAIPTLETIDGTCTVCSSSDTSCANDVHGHGTHCAATVGGRHYGVAKGATIHAVKVLGDNGRGYWSWFIEAIDWVCSNGQRPAILSASLGGSGTSSSVNSAVTDAVNNGVTVVVAAGNDDIDACGYTPAHVPAAITVGATEETNDRRASYSSWGSCLDIYAPGSSIVSAGRSSDSASTPKSGTSMACPHVAGAAALVLGRDSSLAPADVLSDILARASRNKVTDAKTDEGTPNLLLYVGSDRPRIIDGIISGPIPHPWRPPVR